MSKMKFEVTATQPGAHMGRGEWLEASEEAASLKDALALVQQWAEDREVEAYGRGEVTFHIRCVPQAEQAPAGSTWGPWGTEGRKGV